VSRATFWFLVFVIVPGHGVVSTVGLKPFQLMLSMILGMAREPVYIHNCRCGLDQPPTRPRRSIITIKL
jgi:hypothetical protein